MNQKEVCIICCNKTIDENLDLGICEHQEFCTKCCIQWFEKKNFNNCPRCTREVLDFVICSNKIINTQKEKECHHCFDLFDKSEVFPACQCGAMICSFCKFIYGSLIFHECQFTYSKQKKNKKQHTYKPSLDEILHSTSLTEKNTKINYNKEIHPTECRSLSIEPKSIDMQSNEEHVVTNVISKYRKKRRLSKSGKCFDKK